ncbi:MAG: SLBB domain-containing protein [Pirellulaceae bacterium]
MLCAIACLWASGCSSLGLTLYPTGHFLTDQSEQVLEASPREANLPKELSKDVLPVHYLEPGDSLLIEPVDFDSEVRIPADQQILADGSIDLGGYGRAVIAGLPLEEAEELIEQTIVQSGEKATAINIRLLEAVHRYYVLGEVNSPGAYPLKGNETVLDALLTAGGLTGDASPCKLLLARPTSERSCRVTLPICYREITQLGDSSTNYQLRPGDRVYVTSRGFCEEIMCCLATQTCERCCKCQTPCRDPAMIQHGNSYSRVAPNRSMIRRLVGSDDQSAASAQEHPSGVNDGLNDGENAFQSRVNRIPVPWSEMPDVVPEKTVEPKLDGLLDGQLSPPIQAPKLNDSF